MKKTLTILLSAALILSFCFSACTSPVDKPADADPTAAAGTDAPEATDEPEQTDTPVPTSEQEPTVPVTAKPELTAPRSIPSAMASQAIVVECPNHRYSIWLSGRLLSSHAPYQIDEEDARIRTAMITDFYSDKDWTMSALEYSLRLSNSISAITRSGAEWYSPGGTLTTDRGTEAPVWTANGQLPESKVEALDRRLAERFNTAERISSADASFNAHSYAWSGGRTDCGWLEDPLPLMQDPAVTLVESPQPGDIIVYLAPSKNGGDIAVHSAIVLEIRGDEVIVESKLGQCGVYRHALTDTPGEYYYSERMAEEGSSIPVSAELRYLIFRLPGE